MSDDFKEVDGILSELNSYFAGDEGSSQASAQKQNITTTPSEGYNPIATSRQIAQTTPSTSPPSPSPAAHYGSTSHFHQIPAQSTQNPQPIVKQTQPSARYPTSASDVTKPKISGLSSQHFVHFHLFVR